MKIQKKNWLFLSALVLIAQGLDAFGVETIRKRTTTTTEIHPDSSTERVSVREGYSPMVINVAPAILIGTGPALPGFNLEFATRLSRSAPLYGGLVTGSYFYTTNTFAAAIPILPTAYFEFSPVPKLHPILGVALGPVVGVSTASSVRFGMLFRPGMNIYLAPDLALNIETRLGVIGSEFTFVPQLGATFAL